MHQSNTQSGPRYRFVNKQTIWQKTILDKEQFEFHHPLQPGRLAVLQFSVLGNAYLKMPYYFVVFPPFGAY